MHPPRRPQPAGGRPGPLLAQVDCSTSPSASRAARWRRTPMPDRARSWANSATVAPGCLRSRSRSWCREPTRPNVTRAWTHQLPPVARTIAGVHRLERLINLVAALLHADRPLTAEELRARLPGYAEDKAAFRRAFERDKEALRDLGIPVVIEPVDEARDPGVMGYRIPKESYYLQDPGLAPDELAALHLAASAVRLEGASGVEALWKLGGEVAEEGPAPAVAALPGTAHLAPPSPPLPARPPVTFGYRGRPRRVDPWRLSFRNGHWYLAGHDHDA